MLGIKNQMLGTKREMIPYGGWFGYPILSTYVLTKLYIT